MDINNVELMEKVRKFTLASVKPSRYEHCERVAQTAMILCELFDIHPWKGYFSGLAHDMCRDLDDQTLLSLAAHDNRPISEVEKQKPLLLHGRAAAVKLFRDFGVDDTDILQAVARHTLGCEKMRPLAKIIFIADKIEPGRPQSNQKYREPFYTMSLDQMCLTVLDENIAYQKSKNKPVVAQTLAFRESLIRDIQKASNGGAK